MVAMSMGSSPVAAHLGGRFTATLGRRPWGRYRGNAPRSGAWHPYFLTGAIPSRRAAAAPPRRDAAPRLASSAETGCSPVLADSDSGAAIWGLLGPWAGSPSTSTCRSVRPAGLAAVAL